MFLLDILEALENMDDQTKVWALYFYLKWCRQYHAEVLMDKRRKIKQGILLLQKV